MKQKKRRVISSIWKPINKPISKFKLKPSYKRTKREAALIKRNPWGDRDGDAVPNWIDCKPFDRMKQGHKLKPKPEWARKISREKREGYMKLREIGVPIYIARKISSGRPTRIEAQVMENGKIKINVRRKGQRIQETILRKNFPLKYEEENPKITYKFQKIKPRPKEYYEKNINEFGTIEYKIKDLNEAKWKQIKKNSKSMKKALEKIKKDKKNAEYYIERVVPELIDKNEDFILDSTSQNPFKDNVYDVPSAQELIDSKSRINRINDAIKNVFKNKTYENISEPSDQSVSDQSFDKLNDAIKTVLENKREYIFDNEKTKD